jgi:hypothetical protein
MEGTPMDNTDKITVLCIGIATVAIVAMCYKIYNEPTGEDIVREFFHEAGIGNGPMPGVPVTPVDDETPMPKPPSPPITPGEAAQN